MMKEFANAKENYDSIPIPAELPDRVQAGIQLGKASYRRRRSRMIRLPLPGAGGAEPLARSGQRCRQCARAGRAVPGADLCGV